MEKIKQQNILQFVLGEETRPKVDFQENGIASINIESSIFYKQYSLAMTSIAELVAYNNVLKGNEIQNEHFIHNNIIAFNGDRGSGKTSCMLSVKEMLCNSNKKQKYLSNLEITNAQKEILNKTVFYPTEVLDPIFFDENHNILELFIGTLFGSFKRLGKNIAQENRYTLLELFSNAKKDLSLLYRNVISEDDNLEQLDDLVASMNIKKSLWRLVEKYLEIVYPSMNSQLVLCIDDIDLNMTEGYQMIDQIRKYLNIPGLVILLAIKMDQLANVVRIKYSKDYESLLNHRDHVDENKYKEIINQIAERYITKLFPLNQRISMPAVEEILKRDMKIFRENGEIICELTPLKAGILTLIYSRTRMFFYNSSRQANFIIPRNLRELLNLLHFLCNMKEAKNHIEAIPNIIHFKSYFYGTWCTNNLKEDDLAFMRTTQHYLTAININSSIIHYLKERFSILAALESKESDKDLHIRELSYILNKENIMFNLSLGDVLACMDWLGKVCHKDEDLKLLFAIKVFYSMALYENFKYKDEILDENDKFNNEIINKQTLTNNETNYGDIVNGNFFNSEYLDVAPYDKDGMSRCRRIIDNKLLSYISLLLEIEDNGSAIYNSKKGLRLRNKISKLSIDINEGFRNQVAESNREKLRKILEFFILTTSFVFDAKDNEKGEILPKYRRRNEVYYEKNILYNRKYICFDILSIFYNLLNVSKAYERFGLPVRTENSLYADVLQHVNASKPEKREELLHYRLNVRNVEMLEQISYLLQTKRPDSGTDSVDLYKKIFSTLSVYNVQTYDNVVKNVEYGFFKGISDFLVELSGVEKEVFESLFYEKDSIYGNNSFELI